jgi:UDP-N-acetylglucosamine diphosphorylase/glucosamine-1-phosphate N-acetyltransferase
MSAIIFEDERWADFRPISSTRHMAQQVLGSRSVAEQVGSRLEGEMVLWGRDYLARTAKEATGLSYNERPDGAVLAINARINPLVDFEGMVGGRSEFALLDRGEVAMAILRSKDFERSASEHGTLIQRKLSASSRRLERIEAAEPVLFSYPWELLGANEGALEGKAKGRGAARLSISPDADVEEFVAFEPLAGAITIAAGARIESFSRISGPCYVGPRAVVKSALVRGGTSIGEDCRIGGEVDHSIVYPHTNKSHHGYLGHSIVGEWVNIGAGATTSDLKNTYGTVKVQRGSRRVDSGLQKLGAMVGDMAKLSIGTMVHCGRSLGVGAHCSGLVDRDVPDFVSYQGGSREPFRLSLQSVVQTQERMMKRRQGELSRSRKLLIENLYGNASEGGDEARKRP